MAFMRPRQRADGTTAYAVVYRHDGKESSETFDVEAEATEFLDAVNLLGVERARKAYSLEPTKKAKATPPVGPTVADWVTAHIDGLSGITNHSPDEYRAGRSPATSPVANPRYPGGVSRRPEKPPLVGNGARTHGSKFHIWPPS